MRLAAHPGAARWAHVGLDLPHPTVGALCSVHLVQPGNISIRDSVVVGRVLDLDTAAMAGVQVFLRVARASATPLSAAAAALLGAVVVQAPLADAVGEPVVLPDGHTGAPEAEVAGAPTQLLVT